MEFYFKVFVNYKQNNQAFVLLITKFACNNDRNTK